MLESSFILFAEVFEVRNQLPNTDGLGRKFDNLFSLADLLTHPGEIDEIYAHSFSP
jgi:hypothetical protein